MWSKPFKAAIWCLQGLVVFLVWPYSKLLSIRHPRKSVPPPSSKLLLRSATSLAKSIRSKEITCEEVVSTFIKRLKEVDPVINGVVQNRFDLALKEAREVDEMIKQKDNPRYWEENKPLLGVPVTIKESIGVEGMSQSGGRPDHKGRQAEKDAVAVAALKRAGAIVMCVTTTPELCLFLETYNNLHGMTKNPFDSTRTAGGSSGGECALMGAGASVIGLGSDIVGSGRVPALFCGVFGHKPTPRIISVEGHWPLSDDPEWNTFLVLSPICRYAEDLPLLFRACAPDTSVQLRLNIPVDLKKLKVFYMDDLKNIILHSVDPEISGAVKKAADHFRNNIVVPVTQMDIDELEDTLQAASTLMLRMKSPQTVFQRSQDPEDWSTKDVMCELSKRLVGLSKHTIYSISFGVLKKLADQYSQTTVKEMKDFKEQCQQKFSDILGDNGVFILPTFPHTASLHYQMYYKATNIPYLQVFNFLEMPATAVPLGFNKKGLPIGVQVVAWKNQDRLTLAVAQELEKAFGGWQPPSYDSTIAENNNQV